MTSTGKLPPFDGFGRLIAEDMRRVDGLLNLGGTLGNSSKMLDAIRPIQSWQVLPSLIRRQASECGHRLTSCNVSMNRAENAVWREARKQSLEIRMPTFAGLSRYYNRHGILRHQHLHSASSVLPARLSMIRPETHTFLSAELL